MSAPANSNDLLASNQADPSQAPEATEAEQARIDLRALAEKILALFKEELRLERERLSRVTAR
jgi:hypothetical protein